MALFTSFRRFVPRIAQQFTATPIANTSRLGLASAMRLMATITYSPPTAKITQPAPTFTAGAVVDGEIQSVSLEGFRGKWTILLFYPKDFTFVCPTEIIAFSDRHDEFARLNAQVIAISTDTPETHLAWVRTPRKKGGLGYMQIPIVADVTKSISADYGVLVESAGIALRGLFIINPEGVLQQITVNNFPVGRSVDEALRLLQAFQFVAEHGEVCPANWKPGQKTMKAHPEDSLDFFGSGATESNDDPFESSDKIVKITSVSQYHDLVKSGKVVVDFLAPHCGKCRQIFPFVKELSEKYSNIRFAKFDTTDDALSSLATDLGVKALPTFLFYKNGQQVLEPLTGFKRKLLEEQLQKL
jgi:alkyl hydroperoxide reductase subunit AhpC